MKEPEFEVEWVHESSDAIYVWWHYKIIFPDLTFEIAIANPRLEEDESGWFVEHDKLTIEGVDENDHAHKDDRTHPDYWLDELREQIQVDLHA